MRSTRHASHRRKKQEFDDALAALKDKLRWSTSRRPPRRSRLASEIVKGKADVDAAAAANDFDAGLEAVKALGPKLDAYDEALKAFEARKAEYDTALATLQPRLDKALEVKNEKLKDKQQALATGQKSMESAALLGNYEDALKTAKDLATQLDAFERGRGWRHRALEGEEPEIPSAGSGAVREGRGQVRRIGQVRARTGRRGTRASRRTRHAEKAKAVIAASRGSQPGPKFNAKEKQSRRRQLPQLRVGALEG
jgi:hypothetical protein